MGRKGLTFCYAIGLFGCARMMSPPTVVQPVASVIAPSVQQSSRPDSHLKGAYPELYVYVQRGTNLKLTFPVTSSFIVNEGMEFDGAVDSKGKPYFDGYYGLKVKVIRGLSAQVVKDSIDVDIAHAKIHGTSNRGARYGFTARKGKASDNRYLHDSLSPGFAELDLIQKDIKGSGFLYIGIKYEGQVEPPELHDWLLQVIDKYSVELTK